MGSFQKSQRVRRLIRLFRGSVLPVRRGFLQVDNPRDQQDVEGEWAPFAARSVPIIVSVPAIVEQVIRWEAWRSRQARSPGR